MTRLFVVEFSRLGEYGRSFYRAASAGDAIRKWNSAPRFQDRVGKENRKKYADVRASPYGGGEGDLDPMTPVYG